MEAIPALPGLWSMTPLGALIGVLVYIGLAMGRGWWVPKASHERELAAADKRTQDAITRGDEWRHTAREANDVIKMQATNIGKLAESSETSAEFFSTVKRAGGDEHVETSSG